MPSVRSSGSPSRAKNSRMHQATTAERIAMARRCAASRALGQPGEDRRAAGRIDDDRQREKGRGEKLDHGRRGRSCSCTVSNRRPFHSWTRVRRTPSAVDGPVEQQRAVGRTGIAAVARRRRAIERQRVTARPGRARAAALPQARDPHDRALGHAQSAASRQVAPSTVQRQSPGACRIHRVVKWPVALPARCQGPILTAVRPSHETPAVRGPPLDGGGRVLAVLQEIVRPDRLRGEHHRGRVGPFAKGGPLPLCAARRRQRRARPRPRSWEAAAASRSDAGS